jgi:hypothetical protein
MLLNLPIRYDLNESELEELFGKLFDIWYLTSDLVLQVETVELRLIKVYDRCFLFQ